MKKQTQGGKRSNAGRKPVTDPKKGITIYLHQSEIDANGGIERSEICICFVFKRAWAKNKKTANRNVKSKD